MPPIENSLTSATARRTGLANVTSLQGLGEQILSELEAICTKVTFEPGQVVLAEGVEPNYIGCVRRGILRMQKTLYDGRQQIVGLLVEGDMFGHIIEGPMSFAIEAASETTICMFKRKPFEELLSRSQELERLLLLNTLNELERARDWMVILTNYKTNVRLAGFLVVLCTRYFGIDHKLQVNSDRLELNIPITRADLAHLLGTRIESISRAFGALSKKGIIEVKTPYLIEVLDIQRLFFEAGNEDIESVTILNKLMQNQLERSNRKTAQK